MAAKDSGDRETLTGMTGAPQKPKGEEEPQGSPEHQEAEKISHGGGIDLGNVVRGVGGGGYPTDTDDETGADARQEHDD